METLELEKTKLIARNTNLNKNFSELTKDFIRSNFNIRTCVKFKGKEGGLCKCNRGFEDHRGRCEDGEEWSIKESTALSPCNTFGYIGFTGYEFKRSGNYPRFVRFDSFENCDATCDRVYDLLTNEDLWHISPPKLIISINGGLKKMNFISNQQKKNFKQGLIDVMKKDQTWVIGSGFNVGIHKLVSETIYEFRVHQEDYKDQVSLIGISTWGTVLNNNCLDIAQVESHQRNSFRSNDNQVNKTHQLFRYKYTSSNMKGKVILDSLYDSFLFCDDGTERQYDKEIDFRLKFENHVKKKADGFLVQILFEGGRRAIKNAYNSLADKIPLVVIKGSGRSADIISEVMALSNNNPRDSIIRIVNENKSQLQFPKDHKEQKEIDECINYLFEIYDKYKKQVIVYDMMDTKAKFDKKILEAMILGDSMNTNICADKSLEKTLKLCIRFNCPNIAERFVFSKAEYGSISPSSIDKMFMSSLEDNKPDFVNLFLENNFEVEKFINEEHLRQLYQKVSFDPQKCPCAELLNDLTGDTKSSCVRRIKNYTKETEILFNVGVIIEKLSGNILTNFYKSALYRPPQMMGDVMLFDEDISEEEEEEETTSVYKWSSQDLFLWSLISGRTDLSLMFWKIGRDHIGSALMAANILKNMANLVLVRGDNTLQQKLMSASKKYEESAISIVTEAYGKSKSKTYTLIVRALMKWNRLTCLKLAFNGDLSDFLNHSACRSYTTKIWMGDLSPFLSTWKIMLTIPFSLFLMKPLIMPSFLQKKPLKIDVNRDNVQNKHLDANMSQPKSISFVKAMGKFYRAPIVKFYIHLLSYIAFLMFFTYCNLVELKPVKYIVSVKNIFAEVYVYIYVLTFTAEEVRQVIDQEISGFCNKVKNYFSGTWNKFDAFIIFLFICSTITRFTIPDEQFILCRCLFSVTMSLFFIRSMQFYFVNKSLGPKVIMIRDMLRDILFFLSIFVIFVLAYGTLAQALRFPNEKLGLKLLKDIIYFPYFQTYGELMLENFEVSEPCNGTVCIVKNGTIIFSFAIFLLMTNVLLINLLIAMFGYTFNQIQDDSEKLWCFIRIQLVQEFYEKPILPPPLNVLYYIFKVFSIIYDKYCRKTKLKENNLLMQVLDKESNLKMSSFEQFCLEAVLIELNNQNVPPAEKANSEISNFSELLEKLNVKAEPSQPSQPNPMESIASFQLRIDKRLDKIEKQVWSNS